jgi:hypothetical protein
MEIEQLTRRVSTYGPLVWFPRFGNAVSGQVERDGMSLIFHNVVLVWAGLRLEEHEAFQAIITFLEQKHCTDIRYEFTTIPFG